MDRRAVPWLGAAFDVAFRANRRNACLLRGYFDVRLSDAPRNLSAPTFYSCADASFPLVANMMRCACALLSRRRADGSAPSLAATNAGADSSERFLFMRTAPWIAAAQRSSKTAGRQNKAIRQKCKDFSGDAAQRAPARVRPPPSAIGSAGGRSFWQNEPRSKSITISTA
jgi:hypothetical protein